MAYPMSEPRLFKHRAPQFGAMRCLGLRSNDVEQSGVRELTAQSSVVLRHICLRGQQQIALSTACLLQPEQLAGSTAQQEPKVTLQTPLGPMGSGYSPAPKTWYK